MPNSLSDHELADLRRRHYNSTVDRLFSVHEELMILRVNPDFEIPSHRAGQFTALGLGYWEPRCEGCQDEELGPGQETQLVKRAYSLSAPILADDGELISREDEDSLEFYIALVREAEKPPGLTPRMFLLGEGDRLFVGERITGRYTLAGIRRDQTILFLSTGTGEAPHNKMLLELLRGGHRGRIASVVCVRYERDLGYLETHRRVEQRWPQYRYLTLTTREVRNLGGKRYIQELIRTGELEERLDLRLDPDSTHVFLCGNPGMIGVPKRDREGKYRYPNPIGAIELLEKRGFEVDRPRDRGNIHFEEYW